MPYQFVPPYIEQAAVAALDYLPGYTLDTIIAQGAYSRFEVVYLSDGKEYPVQLPYDFTFKSHEDKWGERVAALVLGTGTPLVVKMTHAAVAFEPLPEITDENISEEKVSVPKVEKPVTPKAKRAAGKGNK